jgi:cytochrome c
MTPIPHDIPLPLPFDRVLLQAVIVVLFLAHIIFVNFTVGGSLFAVVFEMIGLRRPDFDTLARRITATVTVNKSLAVVLGVGPLLAINALYTVYFYSANALTGYAWISIVPLVTVAFLVMYVYKYSWDSLAHRKGLHIAIGSFSLLLFLIVPLIFLTNINLMLFPDRWTAVHGFLSALVLPNVLPRYAHFLLACIALTALFMLAYFTRAGFPVESTFQQLRRPTLRRLFYGIAGGATALQLIAGPVVLVTLPRQGVSMFLIVVIVTGAVLGLSAIVLMWSELLSSADRIGRRFVPVVALLMLTGSCMGYGRHIYREQATADHRALVAQRTADLAYEVTAAEWRARNGVVLENLPLGVRVFRDACSSCHTLDRVLVGPTIREIAQLYAANPAGIVAWAKAPGKKRSGFIQMPALTLPDAQLRAAAEHMIQLGSGATSQPTTRAQ